MGVVLNDVISAFGFFNVILGWGWFGLDRIWIGTGCNLHCVWVGKRRRKKAVRYGIALGLGWVLWLD